MNVLQRPQDLVDEVLNVIDRKTLLGVNDTVQIRLHQFTNNIHIFEIVYITHHRWHHIHNPHNILMLEMFKKFDLTKDALGINFILKCIWYHFDSHPSI